jgi:allantoin racemase
MSREARQALDVPFIGPGETTMRLAAMMGAKFGVITQSDKLTWNAEDNIRKYCLKDYAVPVRGLPVSFDDQVIGLTDARVVIEGFIKAGRQLIADGAEVIIPGCMFVDSILGRAPGCRKDYPKGLTEIDGVPVVNVMAMTIKVAEAFVSFKKAGLPWISRKLYYNSAKNDKKALEEGAELLRYKGLGFWLD